MLMYLFFIKILLFFVTCVPEHISAKTHTNNWAVLVDTSRFWFNYRHSGNVLAIYRSIKRLGIPDSRIILMIADDMACNPRNPRPGTVFHNTYNPIDLYGTEVEVDYRGYEVTVTNFLRVLTGRLPSSIPPSKRLNSDEHSNILIYMTGHGGDGFLKFQDESDISSYELADAFEQMWQKKRYNEILFIADTCQAQSLSSLIYSPNIIGVGSSRVGEDSLSHQRDSSIGVFVADRYSHSAMQFLTSVTPDSKKTLAQFLQICPYHECHSHVSVRRDLYRRDPKTVLVTEFFASVRSVEIFTDTVNLSATARVATPRESRIHAMANDENLTYLPQFPFK